MKKILLPIFALATLPVMAETVAMSTLTTAVSYAAAGDNLLANPSFETWTDGKPDSWVSTNTASNATLEQSTEAKEGSSAVLVKGASSNKRLATAEMNLEAGTYVFTVSAKSNDAGAIKLGYAFINDKGTLAYSNYSDQVDLTTDWKEASFEFTLSAATQVNMIVMNPKAVAKDVIVDCASLTLKEEVTPENPDTIVTPVEGVVNMPFESASPAEADGFALSTSEGGVAWNLGSSYAKATGYNSTDKTGIPTTAWLVTPTINTTSTKDVTLSFASVARFGSAEYYADNVKVMISTDYAGDVNAATWTDLGFVATSSSSWTFTDESIVLPAEFKNKNVNIAFLYKCGDTSESAITWEVKNIKVTDAEPAPEEPLVIDDELKNGGFEEWTDEKTPAYWTTTTGASSATLAQSTDANDGNYAVEVKSIASGNKRIASRTMVLKAGSYSFSFDVKANEEGVSCRPGYVPVKDGAILSSNYTYGDYVNDISTEWSRVTYTFELAEDTELNLIVMAPKSNAGKSFFMDNATLTAVPVGVANVEAAASVVTVYNLAGQVVRKNVKAEDALKNLAPGIYVVDGEKVLVK